MLSPFLEKPSNVIKRRGFKIELSAVFNMDVTRLLNIIGATTTTRPTKIPISQTQVVAPVSFGVRLAVTITFTTVYGLLFFFIMVQLWLKLYYRHKRLSYQSIFLFICFFLFLFHLFTYVLTAKNTDEKSLEEKWNYISKLRRFIS